MLNINPEKEVNKIKKFLKREMKNFNKDRVIVGLSGGLDSSTACYLAVKILGKENVFGLIMPEKDSDEKNMSDAEKVAKNLGINYEKINITPVLEELGVYELLPARPGKMITKTVSSLIKKIFPDFSPYIFAQKFWYGKLSKFQKKIFNKYGFIGAFLLTKVKIRMALLYHYAYLKNGLVLGTTDKTEWLMGFYDKYGDGAHDISIIKHLYKTEIKKVADYLGVPKNIVNKPASPDLFPGADEEAIIGVSPLLIDKILVLFEEEKSDNEIMKTLNIKKKTIKSVRESMRLAEKNRTIPKSLL